MPNNQDSNHPPSKVILYYDTHLYTNETRYKSEQDIFSL